MKSPRLLKASILAGLVLAGLSVCQADIVYQDTFNRVGTLNGSAPTVDNTGADPGATWSGNANFTTDGTHCVIPSDWSYSWPAIGLPIDMGFFWDTTISCDVKLDDAGTDDWVGLDYGPANFWSGDMVWMQLSGNGKVNAYCRSGWSTTQLLTDVQAGIPGGWNTISLQYSNYAATVDIIVNGTYLAQGVPISLSGAGGVNLLQYNQGGGEFANFTVTTPGTPPTPPSMDTQPVGKVVFAGDPVTLTSRASGTVPLAYQWRQNDSEISGATSANLSIPATIATDTGSYTVVVTNAAGAVTSAVANVVVHLKSEQILAADDFSTYVNGSYGFTYTYSSTNVSLPAEFTYPQTGGTDGSIGSAAVLDGSAWTDVQVDYAGLVYVYHLPVSLGTDNLYAYQYSLDVRVENLLPDKTTTGCGLQLTFKTPSADVLKPSQSFNVSSNFQHFTFNLNTADFGGSGAADLAAFPANRPLVNVVEFVLTLWSPAGDFVRGPGVSVVVDNLKLVQRSSPPLSVSQNLSGQTIVEWADATTTLQSATDVAGSYTDVADATSPYTVPAGHDLQFFRTRW